MEDKTAEYVVTKTFMELQALKERVKALEDRLARRAAIKPELPPLEVQKEALVKDILEYFKEAYRCHLEDGLTLRQLTVRYNTVARKFGGIKVVLKELLDAKLLATKVTPSGGQRFYYFIGQREVDTDEGKNIYAGIPSGTKIDKYDDDGKFIETIVVP